MASSTQQTKSNCLFTFWGIFFYASTKNLNVFDYYMWIWWWNRVKLWMVFQWMMKMEIWHCNQMSQFLYIYIATLQWNKTVFMWCFVWQTMQKIYTYGIYMTNFRGSCCESAKVKSQHSISIHIIIIIIVNVVVVIVWCIDTRTNRFCGFSYSFKQ